MAAIPEWIRKARGVWKYRGQSRPSFAEAVQAGQESVWDYPRPPRIETDSRQVIVKWAGTLIASTNRAKRVLETASPPTFYLPPTDVRLDLLTAASGSSICEWKGQATYWTLVAPGVQPLRNAAWTYEDPFEDFQPIAGYVAFYPALLECYIGAERVAPQPGGIYGGWVTPEVVGPFKGEPGTENW